MSLSQGRPYLAIPGPSIVPDEVQRAMHRAAPNIYEGELLEMIAGLVPDLRRVARTKGDVALYICNGHGVWEASLANVIAPGDKVLVLATGYFGKSWAEMAAALGAQVEMLDFGTDKPVDPMRVETALRSDKAHEISAVLAVHVDTSTSIMNDIKSIRAAMNAAGHPALLMADCIASLACDRFEMDEWGVDVTVAASQKGLMLPPGMGFVYFSEKAAQVRAQMNRVSRYWDWNPRVRSEAPAQFFGGTPPTHHLYGLRTALDMIHGEGIEAVWARHETLAQAIWVACDIWGQVGPLTLNVADPAQRSCAVTALAIGKPYGTSLRRWVQDNTGVTLGIGLGMSEPDDPDGDGYFRMGHMGHVNAHMVLGMLGTVAAGLTALDIPHGQGALEAAASVMSGA